MSTTDGFVCPVCGFPQLLEEPWSDDAGSLEICPSCGTQFGYNDAAGGDAARRARVHRERRIAWIAAGCPWAAPGPPPPGWDAATQLKRLAAADPSFGEYGQRVSLDQIWGGSLLSLQVDVPLHQVHIVISVITDGSERVHEVVLFGVRELRIFDGNPSEWDYAEITAGSATEMEDGSVSLSVTMWTEDAGLAIRCDDIR